MSDEPLPINYQTNLYDLGDGKFAQMSHLGFINYYNGSDFVPINTTIIPSLNPLYDYEVTKGVYQTFFKENPTEGQAIKFMIGSEYITYQPMALNYRNDLSQLQQISMINSVQGIPNDNTFLYKDGYGSGIDLQYSYGNDYLKEDLIINSFSDLVSPEQYIIDGGNATLDLGFILTTNSNKIIIDDVEWDKKNTKETSDEVYITDEYNNVLYYLRKPYAYDSNNCTQILTYQFRKTGNSLYVTVKTPYSWISNTSRVFPVYIDPDTGATSPGTMADDDAVGTHDWLDVDNAKIDDANEAYCNNGEFFTVISHYLKATNFGFSISSGATIDGIKVEWKKRSGSPYITDEYVQLVDSDGSIVTENKADTSTKWLSTDGGYYIAYGADDDLWGETWTDTDINDAGFGAVISADIEMFQRAQIFHVKITVYYTTGPSPPTGPGSGMGMSMGLGFGGPDSASLTAKVPHLDPGLGMQRHPRSRVH